MRNGIASRLVLGLAAVALAGSACGGPSAGPPVPETPADRSDFPVDVEGANGTVTIESRPDRIVSLSATATEMLFAIDAGDQVAAVDSTSDFPPEAPTTELSAFSPNIEAIAAEEPDLVVLSDDIEDVVAGLTKLDIAVLLLPAAANLEDTYSQIEKLGAATGHSDDASELVEQMRARVSELSAQAPEPPEPSTYYHELDNTYYTVTSATFLGEIYGLAGLRNIADAAPDTAGGYPQLSSEYIVDADPDYIFLADTKCCGQSAETVAARPGWSSITAVERGNVIPLDDDIASRWGPRIVDLLEVIVGAVTASGAPGEEAA